MFLKKETSERKRTAGGVNGVRHNPKKVQFKLLTGIKKKPFISRLRKKYMKECQADVSDKNKHKTVDTFPRTAAESR